MQIAFRNLFLVLFVNIAVLQNGESRRLRRSSSICGSPTRQAGFIFGGSLSTRGEFPWLVALMYAKTSPPSFIGGGTLISARHVVTAGHCIKPKDGPFIELRPADIIAQFGAYNISNPHELGKHSLSPEEIIVHEDWNQNVARYDADIAMLIFEEGDIPITRYVQPVCLWSTPDVPQNTEGLVAGWGKSEDESRPYEEIPKKIKLPIRSNEDCLIKSSALVKLFSKRTFCAGREDGSGVCLGDSGNGLVVQFDGRSYLRGIVSSSLLFGASCDVTNYAIYTDVLKFSTWIMQIVNDGGNSITQVTAAAPDPVHVRTTKKPIQYVVVPPYKEEDGEDSGGHAEEVYPEVAYNELDCSQAMMDFDFEYLGGKKLKTCMIKNQNIASEKTIVRRSADASTIQGLNIESNRNVEFLPEKLGESYPELSAIRVSHCNVKSIEGKHFEGLRKLMFLSLFGNKIESISSDAFKDLSSLQFLHLSNNENMKRIDPMAFKDLPSMKYIWIDHLNLVEVPENLFKHNPHMVRICLKNNKLRYVSPNTFEGLDELKTVILANNACAYKTYFSEQFATMRSDLIANCNKKPT